MQQRVLNTRQVGQDENDALYDYFGNLQEAQKTSFDVFFIELRACISVRDCWYSWQNASTARA